MVAEDSLEEGKEWEGGRVGRYLGNYKTAIISPELGIQLQNHPGAEPEPREVYSLSWESQEGFYSELRPWQKSCHLGCPWPWCPYWTPCQPVCPCQEYPYWIPWLRSLLLSYIPEFINSSLVLFFLL